MSSRRDIHPARPAYGKARTVAEVTASLGSQLHSGSLPTGFEPLDTALEGGIKTRELTLVGGVPGVGKTAATLQWARNVAYAGYPAVYVCYEHDESALLGRLLALEVGSLSGGNGLAAVGDTRELIRGIVRGERDLHEELAGNMLLRAAYGRLETYAENLSLVRGSAIDTDLETIEALVETLGSGSALFIDYLQKIPGAPGATDDEKVVHQAEGLKEIAMLYDVAIVAVVSGDQEGLSVRRLRMNHLRGAAGLAYECDVAIMLNEKYLAVSKRHSAYDPVRAESFKRLVVFSVDKNREGQANIDLEYMKDFPHYRFDPHGGFVEDRLIDDLMYPE
jgi:replicative DNA helicase